jgi:hypothetical protein
MGERVLRGPRFVPAFWLLAAALFLVGGLIPAALPGGTGNTLLFIEVQGTLSLALASAFTIMDMVWRESK